jgi:hypothetical protein
MQKVRLVKILLGAGAAVLTAALFVLSGPGRQMVEMADPPPAVPATPSAAISKPVIGDVASTVMTNPRFFGEDNNNRRWEVKADRAEQFTVEGMPSFKLIGVYAEAEIAKGAPLLFVAGEGHYMPDEKKVSLSRGVKVSGYDYVVNTRAVMYDLATGEGKGEGGVEVRGPRGELSSAEFDLTKDGRLLRLYGGVKARLYPEGAR